MFLPLPSHYLLTLFPLSHDLCPSDGGKTSSILKLQGRSLIHDQEVRRPWKIMLKKDQSQGQKEYPDRQQKNRFFKLYNIKEKSRKAKCSQIMCFSPTEKKNYLNKCKRKYWNIQTLGCHLDRYIFFPILRKKQSSSPIDEICVRLFFSDLTSVNKSLEYGTKRPPLEIWKNLSQLLDRASW